MKNKPWKENINTGLDRVRDYMEVNPAKARIAMAGVIGASALVLFGTPAHKYTIDPVQRAVAAAAQAIAGDERAAGILEGIGDGLHHTGPGFGTDPTIQPSNELRS